ncbi:MAG: hypothetical protein IH608_09860, partial [Proteobacteria bacterium]|nr:hypothetical protein [Pseudomonadota bacterium]
MGLVAELSDREEERTHLWVTFERDGRALGRVVSAGGRVRWGSALGLEFTYPIADAPPAEELFSRGRSGPRLRLRDGMAGEIAAGWSTRLSVEDLDALGIARGWKGRRWLPLSPQMQGQVAYRGFRISFHFGPGLEVGEVQRLGRVPLRFRRAPLAREEWPFTLLAWGLYGLLLYLSVYLVARPLPLAPHPEAVAQRFAKLIYEAPQAPSRARTEILKKQEAEKAAEPAPEPEKTPEPEPAPEKPAAESKAEPAKPEVPPPEPQAPPEPRPVPKSPEGGGGPTPEQVARRREKIRDSVAKKGLLGLLGGRGTASTTTARGSILEGRGAAEDLDRVLA